jgi:ParB family chromosome partitioning protein
METKENILRLQVNKLINSPFQGRLFGIDDELPREESEKVDELADSIRENGMMQPIVVRPANDGNYEIIDGHRRVIATKLLGRGQIKAIIRDYDDKQAQTFNIIGNLQRKDLNNIELALSYQRALDSGLFPDRRALALAIAKDETYVGDVLNMLRMDKRVIDDLLKNRSIQDARILRMIRVAEPIDENGLNDEQWRLYRFVKDQDLSRNQVKTLLDNRKKQKDEIEGNEVPIDIKYTQKGITFRIDYSKVNTVKKSEIKKLINENTKHLKKEINKLVSET